MTSFRQSPMVESLGDVYIGPDGAKYYVTQYPKQVDSLGIVYSIPDVAEETHSQTIATNIPSNSRKPSKLSAIPVSLWERMLD